MKWQLNDKFMSILQKAHLGWTQFVKVLNIYDYEVKIPEKEEVKFFKDIINGKNMASVIKLYHRHIIYNSNNNKKKQYR
jgi:hypothetical protein